MEQGRGFLSTASGNSRKTREKMENRSEGTHKTTDEGNTVYTKKDKLLKKKKSTFLDLVRETAEYQNKTQRL